MFGVDKVKAANNLRKLKNELDRPSKEVFDTNQKGRYKVVVRGDKHIERIEVDGVEDKLLKELINDTQKSVEKKLEKKARSSGSAAEMASMMGIDL